MNVWIQLASLVAEEYSSVFLHHGNDNYTQRKNGPMEQRGTLDKFSLLAQLII